MVVKRKKGNATPTYNTSRLRVGFIDSATYPDGQNVATVAFWNEYGTEKIPPRPFMRTTVAQNRENWVQLVKQLVPIHGADKSLLKLGQEMQGKLVFSILNWTEPPNAPYTIAKKGFNKPLVEQGIMSRSISYELTSDSE